MKMMNEFKFVVYKVSLIVKKIFLKGGWGLEVCVFILVVCCEK
jgi:hypothetical protein